MLLLHTTYLSSTISFEAMSIYDLVWLLYTTIS